MEYSYIYHHVYQTRRMIGKFSFSWSLGIFGSQCLAEEELIRVKFELKMLY